MPTNKRSRGSNAQPELQALHAKRHLDLDTEKDTEELELEAALFGKKRKRVAAAASASVSAPSKNGKGKAKQEEEERDDEEEAGLSGFFGGEMPAVSYGADDDEDDDGPGFFMDVGGEGSGSDDVDEDEDEDGENSAEESEDDEDSDSASSASSASNPYANDTFTSINTTSNPLAALSRASGSKPLWHDPSDSLISVDPSSQPRLRKLVRGTKDALKTGEAAKMGGEKLEKKLREQFEKMHPAPSWAKPTASSSKSSTSSNTAQTLLSSLLTTTQSVVARADSAGKGPLPKGELRIKRQRDANFENRTGNAADGGGGIKVVKFHSKVGALAVVGGDKRLRMFSIDGHTNPSLLTLHIPSLPLTAAHFHPSGTSLFLAGTRPFFYTYDLRSQRCLRSPQNLFGPDALSSQTLEKSVFSPDGSMLAVAGRKAAVHILSWQVGAGAGQVIMTLNSGRQGGIRDLMWMKEGRELWVLGEGSEVDVWDVAERRCVWRWTDEGGFGGVMLKRSADGAYCAVGSTTGIVNVYNTASISSPPISEEDFDLPTAAPKPIRSLMNLTTSLSTLAFNHDGQMMAVASEKKKDAFRMFHLPSATAFTNWPTSSTPLGSVTSADFSAGSEYLAIGNTRGKVLLYSVSHYNPQ